MMGLPAGQFGNLPLLPRSRPQVQAVKLLRVKLSPQKISFRFDDAWTSAKIDKKQNHSREAVFFLENRMRRKTVTQTRRIINVCEDWSRSITVFYPPTILQVLKYPPQKM